MTSVELALAHFCETLERLQVQGQTHDRKLGMPPRHLIVEQTEPSSNPAFNTGTALQRWRVDLDGVASVSLDDVLPKTVRDGMYYDYGRGDFSLRDEGRTVRIGWVVGPTYGLGYDLPVERDEGSSLRFGPQRTIWVS